MKNIKKYIIITIIIIIIILISLLLIIKNISNNGETNDYFDVKNTEFESGDEYQIVVNQSYRNISSFSDFFRVKEIIERYYNYISKANGNREEIIEYEVEGEEYGEQLNKDEYYENEKKSASNALYYMLGEEYIKEFDITLENIEEKIIKKHYCDDFIIESTYVVDNSENVKSYYISGKKLKQNSMEDFSMLIEIDSKNETFSIYLKDYLEKHQMNNYKVGQKIENEIKEIKNRTYNNTVHQNIEESKEATYYYETYMKLIKYNEELLYNKLDNEYKEKRFKNVENFKSYISKNIESLKQRNIMSYNKQNHTSYVQYVVMDQVGDTIIFNITSPTEYTILLDTYTIDLPEFIEKYNNATNEEKVLLNIQKFFEAINSADYEYAYSKLDETYKANNFKTLADFEKYIKENFYEQNKASARNAEKQDDIYLYTITISDASGKNEKTITKTFVMQLKEGTDFVMSFSVN